MIITSFPCAEKEPLVAAYKTSGLDSNYCKTLNISVPLMLAKLAMRYHSLTFVVAKINVYCYACAVVCHVVSKTVVPFAAKL